MIADVVVASAGPKGKGVFAQRTFRTGEFIFRRRHGRVVTNTQIATLSPDERRHLTELDFSRSAVLLAPGCYLNHSCEPNAMRRGVTVLAWRRIRRGAEVTIDYRLNAFGGRRFRCFCGTPKRPHFVINSFFALSPARQQAYLPYAPAFIRAELRRRARRAGASASRSRGAGRKRRGGRRRRS